MQVRVRLAWRWGGRTGLESYMKRLLRILGKIGKIGIRAAPAVAEIAFPHLSGIIELVFTATAQAESNLGPGRGREKREQAMQSGALVVQMLAPILERSTGRDVDDEKLLEIYGKACDLVVEFHNAIGTFPKKDAA
jgi:hypothetical protein